MSDSVVCHIVCTECRAPPAFERDPKNGSIGMCPLCGKRDTYADIVTQAVELAMKKSVGASARDFGDHDIRHASVRWIISETTQH